MDTTQDNNTIEKSFSGNFENCPFKNSVEIQVRFNDIDMLGHVSNTVYLNYFDTGKSSYMNEVIQDYDFKNEAMVEASVKIDFLEPVFMNEKIAVLTRVIHLGNKSFTFEHHLINANTKKVHAMCTAIMVCFNPQKQESIFIPELWREKIQSFECHTL